MDRRGILPYSGIQLCSFVFTSCRRQLKLKICKGNFFFSLPHDHPATTKILLRCRLLSETKTAIRNPLIPASSLHKQSEIPVYTRRDSVILALLCNSTLTYQYVSLSCSPFLSLSTSVCLKRQNVVIKTGRLFS